jgi:hypothetical protein
MQYLNITLSRLPTFLLPCPRCGHRMVITAVAPAPGANGVESNGLEEITHGCVQCGTTLTRTIRLIAGDHTRAPAGSDFDASLSAGSAE